VNSSARTYFLVKDLIDELENEQIQLGTGAYLRVQELLRLLPDDISDADLLLALAPLLARSGREQELIYEKFALCQRRADEVLGPRPPDDPQKPKPIDPIERKIKSSKRWFWAAAALLAAVLAGLLWKFYVEEKPILLEKSFAVNAGQISSICPTALPELDSLGGKIARFELKFIQNDAPDTARTRRPGSVWAGSSGLADYYVQNDSCLLVAARDSVQAMDSLVLNVFFANQKKGELRLRIFIAPQAETGVEAGRDTVFRPQIRSIPFDSIHRQALRDLQIQADPWATWLYNNWYWLRWVIFGPFCMLLSMLWPWWEWRPRKLYAQLERKDKPPYVWNVEIPGVEEVLLDDTYRHALQVMRRRSQSEAQRLDMERTIAATVEGGGLPRFHYRPLSQPVDYLLLLDRQQTSNHRAQLFDAFYRAFKAQELAIERYFYDSDLRLCFNEAHPEGIRLTELAQRFAGTRLVLVGSGLQLIHPLRGGLVAWADLFEHWPQRLLLTPRHPEEWGRNERLLGTLFQVLPATLASLGFWVEELEQGEDARFDRWQERVKEVPAAVFQPDEAHPLASLLLQFPREVLRWVAACAIYPSLHWDLTLWFGQQLEARSGEPLLEHDTLLRLFRIRWFVEGQMPQTAREQLLEWLDGQDPTLVPALRHDLAAVLAQSPPPEDSMAWADHRLQLVFNRWMSASNRKEKQKQEKELARLLPQAEVDFVALKYLDAPPSPLHFEVPPTWKKYVYRGGLRGLGFSDSLKNTVAALAFVLVGLLFVLPWKPVAPLEACAGERTKYVLDNSPLNLCLKNERDFLLYQEFQLRDSIEAGKLQPRPRVSSPLYAEDSVLVQEVFRDLGAAYYNKGVAYFKRNLRDSACLFFGRALQYDSLAGEHLRAWAWCNPATKPGLAQDTQPAVSRQPGMTTGSGSAGSTAVAGTALGEPEMILVRAGTFQMGSNEGLDSEKPVHSVSVSNFYIGKYEVTQKQWRDIMGSDPPGLGFPGCDQCPVESVSWDDIQEFLQKLNAKFPGKNYRLPSEAEWEYAARGGAQSKGYEYAGSNNVAEVAWYGDIDGKTHPVGGKKANELGIYDMSGNVWEWCQDVWHQNYQGAPGDGSAWTSGDEQDRRVLRGGSWVDYVNYCRSASRNWNRSTDGIISFGFRLARHP
jgi:formylglycine-generating enzyme required for sulfatase activity